MVSQSEEASPPFSEEELHLIKELDQDLISKILLIAEEKADKKYVISNNHTAEYHDEALELRDRLIEIIIDTSSPPEKEAILSLAKQMLNFSRKCKRKNVKGSSSAQVPQESTMKQVSFDKILKSSSSENDNIEFVLPPEVKQATN